MKILVIGVEGYIGLRVALALRRSGQDEVVGAALSRSRVAQAELQAIGLDARRPGTFVAALEGVDAVVSCLAGAPAGILAGAEALYRSALPAASPLRIIHVSSMTVYGATGGDVGEDAPLKADLGPYSEAQARAEALASTFPGATILRPGCEFGPGGEVWSGRIARWLFARRLGDLGADGDGCCNLLYIDDLCDAVTRCLGNPAAIGAAFNLAMPDPPTWNEYFLRFAKALGAVPAVRVPRWKLALETRVLAAPLKALELLARASHRAGVRTPEPIPPSLLRVTRQDARLAVTKAREVLGWRCTPLDQALAQTAAWYRSAKGLRS